MTARNHPRPLGVTPEAAASGCGSYKGYRIEHNWITSTGKPQPDEYTFVHPDYDGPGDSRCGYGPTLEDCMEQIDDIEEQRTGAVEAKR